MCDAAIPDTVDWIWQTASVLHGTDKNQVVVVLVLSHN